MNRTPPLIIHMPTTLGVVSDVSTSNIVQGGEDNRLFFGDLGVGEELNQLNGAELDLITELRRKAYTRRAILKGLRSRS
jgi:hypothetical protein